MKNIEFQQLLEEGKNVPLNLQELVEISEINNRINLWFSHAIEEIEKGVQLDLIEELFRMVFSIFQTLFNL